MKTTGVLLLTIFCSVSFAQSSWMGNRITQTRIFVDPTEIQMSVSMNGILNQNITDEQYVPFTVGVDQSIFSKQISEDNSWEVVGEMGVFTQFEWKEVEGIQQRNLINIDYKIAFSFVKQINKTHTYRLRFFHVSSHLGDDYIIRNEIRSYTENKMNYEQLEFTYFHNLGINNARIVAGVGSVIRPNAKRLPFSYLIGMENLSVPNDKKWGLTGGWIVKGFQETDFNLNFKIAAGVSYKSELKEDLIRLVLEYYAGHLPYSQFEQDKTQWIGLGLYFNL